MILQIARAQKKIGTFIKTNNEWLLSDFFNSSEEIASGKMSPRPVIKVIWGERHISELSSSHHQTTMYTAPAPLFSTNFPYNSTQNGLEFLMGHHYCFDQFFFLTLAKKSPCVGYNIKKFGFVNNVRCAFLTEWVVDDDDRAFGVELLCTMSWCEIIQSCTLRVALANKP